MNLDTLKNRLKHGFNANGFGFLINLSSQIIVVPFFIFYWGAELYGEWILLSAFTAYIAISNFGLSDSAATEMTIATASKNYNKASDIFKSVWFVVSISSILLSIIFLSIIFFYFSKSDFGIYILGNNEVFYIIASLVIYLLIGLQYSLLSAVYRASGLYALNVSLLNYIRSAELIFGLFFVYIGFGPFGLILIHLFIRLIGYIISLLIIKSKVKWLRFWSIYFNLKLIKSLIKPSFASIGFTMGNLMINQGIIIIIGMFLGSYMVASFNIIRTLTRVMLKLSAVFINSFLPEMSTAYGAKKMHLLKFLNRRLLKISFSITFLSTIFLLIFGKIIIELWTRNQIIFDSLIINLLIIEVLFYSVWYCGSVVIISANKHFKAVSIYLISGFFANVCCFLFISNFGIKAVPVFLILSDIVVAIYVINEMLKITHDNFLRFIKFILNY